MACKYCGSINQKIKLRVFQNSLKVKVTDPKWLPHIYIYCGYCWKYNQTLVQTEELRKKIDGMELIPWITNNQLTDTNKD